MIVTGFLVLILAGFFQGTYGLGMKKYQPFSWEAMWALFSILGMVVTPCVWAYVEVPGFTKYIFQTPAQTLFMAAFCGFFWGVTAIGFGKAIDFIGLSLTNGIAMGVSSVVGSLLPLVVNGQLPSGKILAGLAVGNIVMIVGISLLTKAGLMKDEQNKISQTTTNGTDKNKFFKLGLVLAFVSGLGSAAQNFGFSFASYTSQLAVADGVDPTKASIVAWIVVISFGGFIANFGYALCLLIKNRTFVNYTEKGCGIGYLKVLVTGIAWYAALGIYGKATVLLGDYGTVIGWIGFSALALIISNAWGLKIGEWKGFEAPKKYLYLGNLVLIAALVVIGITNGMQ